MIKELFKEIVEQITFDTQFGITVEIEDFFKDTEGISEYKVETTDDKKYNILVKLNNYNLQIVKRIFYSFLHFIEYSAGSFYIRENNENSTEYYLVSVIEDNTGFFCHIIFSN